MHLFLGFFNKLQIQNQCQSSISNNQKVIFPANSFNAISDNFA